MKKEQVEVKKDRHNRNKLILRIYSTYIPEQKFDSIRISVHHDVRKIWKIRIKDVKDIYFRNNNLKSY